MSQKPAFFTKGKYRISSGISNEFTICYNETKPIAENYWQSVNPMMKGLPIFLLQLSVVIAFSRVFMIFLGPLRQPRFLSQLLAGIILGPGLLGASGWISNELTPFEGNLFLETMANLGVTFYMFLVGLEMDITPIRKMGKTAVSIAIAGILFPMATGIGLHSMTSRQPTNDATEMGAYFWSICLTLTSFPDLARMLSDLKLLYTDLGKMALTVAVVNDLSCWCFLIIAVCLINGKNDMYVALPVLMCMTMFWFMLRPFIRRVVKHISNDNKHGLTSDKHIYFILSLVFLSGFITELCGAHSIFGAFMFGLMIPNGEVGNSIMSKVEDFVVGILLPPIFLITGFRTNVQFAFAGYSVGLVILVVFLACSAKIVGTLLVSLYFKCPMRDGLALGVLMNTKGVLALIVLNEGRNMQGFDQQTFAWVVFAIVFMTLIIGPVVSYTHKSTRQLKSFNERNLERCKPNAPLRVLACVHSIRNLSGLINLLQISNATSESPIMVFAVQLIELAGRASTMLIFHDKNKTVDTWGNNSREKAEVEQIVSAFESFEKENHAATVIPLTAVSPYPSMHEDVNNFALDKVANIILIPFHKRPDPAGGWTDENHHHKLVNENLLATSRCSIGLLVDRGLTCSVEPQIGMVESLCRVAMLFVEGPDDREALAYAWRMAGHPSVKLTLVRFVPGKEVSDTELVKENGSNDDDDNDDDDDDEVEAEMFTENFERESQKHLDDDYINEFRFRTMNDYSIMYNEKQVNSGDQIVSAISNDYNDFDLYLVGRGDGRTSALIEGLSIWTEFPELGPLGETLVSMDLECQPSVLVVQQSCSIRKSVSKKTRSTSDHSKDIFGVETIVNHRRPHDNVVYI